MEKLKRKMIRTVFLSVLLVFFVLTLVSHFFISYYFSNQADASTLLIEMNNYKMPNYYQFKNLMETNELGFFFLKYDAETYTRTRYFTVELDENLNLIDKDMQFVAIGTADDQHAEVMAQKAVNKNSETGYIDEFRYRVNWNGASKTYTVIFLNCNENLTFKRIATLFLLLLAIIFTFLVTLVFSFFSNRFMRPFEENSRRQKQFITDASHELKTPLSIISANAQVLEYKTGANEWTHNIVQQTNRMTNLINELTTLSKMDEIDTDLVMEIIDFSEIIQTTMKPFQEVIEEKGASLSLIVPDNITFCGNKEQLTQLVSILGENASKYVSRDGLVQVTLSYNRRNATLRVFNTCELDADFNESRLFDRFYRPDSSRTSSTGGHGIGLSIAKKIVSQHNGSIDVKKEKNGIIFSASVSRKINRTESFSK